MPFLIKRYRCKDCNREYDSFKLAKACEDSHPRPVAVRAFRYTIRKFPYQVEVEFSDGSRHIFNADELGG